MPSKVVMHPLVLLSVTGAFLWALLCKSNALNEREQNERGNSGGSVYLRLHSVMF
jgi:hypothetical protein